MRQKILLWFFYVILLSTSFSGYSQEYPKDPVRVKAIIDSLRSNGIIFHEDMAKPDIELTREQAVRFLQQRADPKYWNNTEHPFRIALSQLVFEATHERFDSVETYLRSYPYDSLYIPWDKFYIWEPLRFKIPFVSPPEFPLIADSSIKADTVFMAIIDTVNSELLLDVGQLQKTSGTGLKDTTILVVIDTLYSVPSAVKDFPFSYLEYPYQSDSIRVAVSSLLDYVSKRDSLVINFTGLGKTKIPVWLNSTANRSMKRYWLKNEFSDSVTVWIGNEGQNTFGLYLEHGINFRKPARQENYSEARINVQAIDKSKLEQQKNIIVKNHYWRYKTESSLIFNQSALSNWVKGGENSISTALDITGYANFNRPELKLSSANFARLKLGFLKSGDNAIRKNLDLLETNSKLNHKAWGKFDFSAIMLFKTQVTAGKAYTKVGGRDTSYLVSRLFNPAILTLGFGLDYKPNKETSINFSPLSYKGTFVPAAGKMVENGTIPRGKIDQTRYGVSVGRKSLNEPGASFQISKISRPFRNITVTNRLQLFTNYIKNPQNIDIDWEMIAVANLNWFTDLRLNTHLIFDDDTMTPELDKDDKPILREDGTPMKTARVQFKEMFGVSLVFRF